MGPIDTTVAPRPTLPQAGAASSGLMTQDDVLQKLTNELSLSEGLTKRRQEFATTGQGRQIYDALSDPSKVMTGIDPNANLKQGIDLRQGYEQSIAKAGANTMDVLTAISSILKERKNAEQSARELKLQENKFKADLATKNMVLDENTGEPRGMTQAELDANPYAMSGTKAIAAVTAQGGSDLINMGKDKESQKAIAESILKAGGVKAYRDQLPGSEIKKNILQDVEDLLAADTSGIAGVVRYGFVPGTEANRQQIIMDRLKSSLALDNVKLLKGQGAVSDAERKLLEDASSRLKQTQKNADFRKELLKLKEGLSGKSDTVEMTSPDGKKYLVPSSEVEEAKKNGWK